VQTTANAGNCVNFAWANESRSVPKMDIYREAKEPRIWAKKGDTIL
jgi:hypothetical protein